ncbi:MAG: amino acid permease [Bacteroidia bacterium]|nr:amino acid permease [Bacteroidia bacterium]NNC84873.1 amino acid permease [Bacteroidia bacterium]NNM16417.1 amino acid permease [Bacteroidia bacterium]
MATQLKKSLNAFELTLFGTGTIIGAGIYVLVGKIAGIAGFFTPLSFIVAAVIALFTALTYAQLASIFPKTASAVVYVEKAFAFKPLSIIVGYLLLATLVITAATIIKGFAGYMQVMANFPEQWVIIGLLLVLGFIALKGINESIWLIGAITLLEVGGLIFVVFVLRDSFSADNLLWLAELKSVEWGNVNTIMSGAFLAFFAFVGFEGIANVAEETKQPLKSIPKAIITSLVVSSILYLLITYVCLGSMPIDELAESTAPMSDLMERKGAAYAKFISIISMIAVVNGVMGMIIMSSRVMYGMAENGLAPRFLFHVHTKNRTPDRATICIIVILFILTSAFSILGLANAASFTVLIVFALVNLALVVLKATKRLPKLKTLNLSIIYPIIGFLLCVLLIVQKILEIL